MRDDGLFFYNGMCKALAALRASAIKHDMPMSWQEMCNTNHFAAVAFQFIIVFVFLSV